jgi:hypothetical protein
LEHKVVFWHSRLFHVQSSLLLELVRADVFYFQKLLEDIALTNFFNLVEIAKILLKTFASFFGHHVLAIIHECIDVSEEVA